MKFLLVLLVASSDAPSTLDEVRGLASAAIDRGHEVVVFFYMAGVSLLKAPADDLLAALVPLGVRLLACRTSAKEEGIGNELMEGAEMSSLGEFVELLERCDRVLLG